MRAPVCTNSSAVTAARRRARPARWPAFAGRLALAAGLSICASAASAQDRQREFVPELNLFVKLSDTTRLFLLGAVTRDLTHDLSDAEAGVHLDITLMPPFREKLQHANWERDRYLWMRLGYQRAGDIDGRADGYAERRAIAELTVRVPLPHEIWLVGRGRMDFRDVDGSDSQRVRLRAGIEREFNAGGVTFVPYAQSEAFRDSRFHEWNRWLHQAGVEIELGNHWRVEPYFAYQVDDRSSPARLQRYGLVFKYYW